MARRYGRSSTAGHECQPAPSLPCALFTEAFERASAAPGAVSPLVHAELTLASGDATGARRALQGLIGSQDPSDRARAIAMLTELELLAGKPDAAA